MLSSPFLKGERKEAEVNVDEEQRNRHRHPPWTSSPRHHNLLGEGRERPIPDRDAAHVARPVGRSPNGRSVNVAPPTWTSPRHPQQAKHLRSTVTRSHSFPTLQHCHI